MLFGIALTRSLLRVSLRVERRVPAMALAKLVCRPRNFDGVDLLAAHPWLLTKNVCFGSVAGIPDAPPRDVKSVRVGRAEPVKHPPQSQEKYGWRQDSREKYCGQF